MTLMIHELKIPQSGESIQEVQIGQWLKEEGQWVERDEMIVELETDKASLDLPAPVAGVLVKILKGNGEDAEIGEVIAQIDPQASPQDATAGVVPGKLPEPLTIMPAAQRLLRKYDLQGREVKPTGPGGRLLKEDVVRHIEELQAGADGGEPLAAADGAALPPAEHVAPQAPVAQLAPPQLATSEPAPAVDRQVTSRLSSVDGAPGRQEEVVPMTLIRRRIAARLVQAEQEAALLTTFNEVDMTQVMDLRRQYRDRFQEKHGVKLGFMSFFVKATIEALKEFPAINAEIREKTIVYRRYFDIGVAIGGGKGLVVPALRNAEKMSFAEIEKAIADFAQRAQQNKLRPEELNGGTFTITNGGVYGSLLSTPIVNPPQSGVLGLHDIQERPVARDGEVVIRPMMYLALTYDHRIVDGREAVTFLKRLQEKIGQPTRMLLEV
jgi:2-oxoglutarate dehydrogenase E2 component (dihydrolipoamide succinyltransferase)